MRTIIKVRWSQNTTTRAMKVRKKLRKRNVANVVRKVRKRVKYLKVKRSMKVRKRRQHRIKAAKERIRLKRGMSFQKRMSLHTRTKFEISK